MREILFKGKRTDNNEWIYGNLIHTKKEDLDYYEIITLDGLQSSTVKTETVRQFTGLTDKNGKKIFEGDVINAQWRSRSSAEVVFESGMFKAHGMSLITWIADPFYRCKIIGNIYDNPELMEGKNDG